MKKLLLLSLLCVFYFEVFAQNEVFRIDSLPQQGILLDKGWKFHAGDNPDFAKPDFDDSKWESIDPTKDIMELKQIPKDGKVIWLRLKMKIDTSLVNSIYGLNINQIGASEIYQNGKLLVGFGQINANPNKNIAVNPSSDPANQNLIFVIFDKNTEVIYAIRFAIQPGILFLKFMERPNPVFKLKLNSFPKVNKYDLDHQSFDSTFMEYFRIGIFFILFLLHFSLFILQRKILANLYSSIYFFLGLSLFILYSMYYHDVFSVEDRMAIVFIEYIGCVPLLITFC